MKQFTITGMSCAACSARIEKAVSNLNNVDSCSVSLLTNSMSVEGSASDNEIINAVTNAGYGASPMHASEAAADSESTFAPSDELSSLSDTESPKTLKRLVASVILLIPLMYVSMGHMMWNWPLPSFLNGNHVAMGLYQLLLTSLIMVINQKFFINGFRGLIHRAPNMDTLVALGSSASFIYSVFALFKMSDAVLTQNDTSVMYYMEQFYFESAAMILTLITVGKYLEARSKGRTTDALKSLIKLRPQTARLYENGTEREVSINQIKIGDLLSIRPGDSIPVDGTIIEGTSAINEASLTGESIPVDKASGDNVYTSTINQSGHLIIRADKIGADTALSQIIKMVSDAAATKAPIAKIADRVSGIFVPAVISISLLTFIIWLLAGQDTGYALTKAVAVLVISCPCALGLATPVAIMVGNGVAAKAGIMFKTASSLEETGRIKVIALDKTGTITRGEPVTMDILPANGVSKNELLSIAYSLECLSEHPLSKAVVTTCQDEGIEKSALQGFKAIPGKGLMGELNGSSVYAGNKAFIEDSTAISIPSDYHEQHFEGKTPLYFSTSDKFLGVITVADTIKDDSTEAISILKGMGLKVVMLTGDNEYTARTIGTQAGVDEVIAGILPGQKADEIAKLKKYGKVAMVGDGINDAPALTLADIGIAIGAGTDVAIDAADVVLMKSSLMDVCSAIKISRSTLKNIHENLFWAFFYNVIGIPLAAGLWVPIWGISLSPMFGAAAMSLSSFCVVTNALRLNFIKPYKPSTNQSNVNINNASIEANDINYLKKEENHMQIKVNGMMCMHCEKHVKEALEKLPGVSEAVASHETSTVTLTTDGSVSEDAIREAIKEAGYEYVGITSGQ